MAHVNQDGTVYRQRANALAEIERNCSQNTRLWEEELPKYQNYINDLLREGNRGQLSELLSSEEFVRKFSGVTEMAYMILINQIYRQEVLEHVEKTVLDGHLSMEEAIAYVQEIRFQLWRLEFYMEEKDGLQLLDFIRQNRVSNYLLKYIVNIAALNKVRLLKCLAEIFLKHGMSGRAFAMLKYADELFPGTEDILCIMADLCLQAGKIEEAAQCMKQIKSPTQITEEICRKLGAL